MSTIPSSKDMEMFYKLVGDEFRDYLWGWYSAEAHQKISQGVIYTDPAGNEVLVTCVGYDPFAQDYLWPDKVLVGPVKDFVRRVNRGYG